MIGKIELLKQCGSIEQVAGIERITYSDGNASGLKAVLVHSGVLEYALMLDKCLDPAWIRYKGMNIGVLTKPGLQGKTAADTDKAEASRSIMCGAMMTCGFENIHGSQSIGDKEYPTHGRMRSTRANHVGTDAGFEGDTYILSAFGEMREAEIFGENIVLRRTVRTTYGSSKIEYVDEIENQAFRSEPFCFLYHCNVGFPFLTKDCHMLLPGLEVTARDADAGLGLDRWMHMEEPRDNAPEQVFLHRLAADKEGNTLAVIVNEKIKMAYCLRFNVKEMPYMVEWKSIASGDYAWAMEPCNTGFTGRAECTDCLEPMEKRVHHFSMEILEGQDEIEKLHEEIQGLLTL